MTLLSRRPRRPGGRRTVSALVAVTSLAAFTAVGVESAVALRDAPPVPAPPAQPTRADQIQNIDQVRTAIKAYYGDTVSGTNPDGSAQHLPSPTGAYAHELAGLERRALAYLTKVRGGHGDDRANSRAPRSHGAKSIVLDVDDTSLNTYNYEIFSNFTYTPASNATFVNSAAFPAVFGMPELAEKARAAGYTVFFLTGRPEAQRSGTEENLAKVGFPATPSSRVYLKDDAGQPWITCDTESTQYDPDPSVPPSCSTVERKSQTRAHIESLGYDIRASFGDQYSDLKGGFADRTFKVPNPMYYLP